MVCHNTIKTLPMQCHFNVSEEEAWKTHYKKIWNEVGSQLFEKMATEPIKKEGRYVNGKLKTLKKCIKTTFHGQDVPYNIHCNATAVLKINSAYKSGKNYHPRVYVEECKYTYIENQQFSILSDDDDGFFLRCKKKGGQKIFVTIPSKGIRRLFLIQIPPSPA